MTSSPETAFPWRNAPRAQRWQPSTPSNLTRLRWATLGSLVSLLLTLQGLWLVTIGLQWGAFQIATRCLGWRTEIPTQTSPLLWLIAGLLGCWLASPWLLDWLLQWGYGLAVLPPDRLAQHSPETQRLIQRYCQQHRIQPPQLRILSVPEPLILTYGSHLQPARIAVSSGLLIQLAADEIATLYARELAYLQHWDFCVLSVVAIVTQLPYLLYWQMAGLTDALRRRPAKRRVMAQLLKLTEALSAIGAAFGYGLFWLCRWSGFWVARQRSVYGDQAACSLTGNPNGLARALIKLAIATPEQIQTQGQTTALLESLESLTPLGYRSALQSSNFMACVPIGNGMGSGEWCGADRRWLTLHQPHPPLVERLAALMHNARAWKLPLEIDLDAPTTWPKHALPLAFPGADVCGIAVGYGLAQGLWLSAHLAHQLGNSRLNWLASDYRLFVSLPLIGFGVGTLLQFNRLFPPLPAPPLEAAKLLETPPQLQATAPTGTPIVLQGILLGRSGCYNGVNQAWLLRTDTGGVIRLQMSWLLGLVDSILNRPSRLSQSLGQPITVTGWLHQGVPNWVAVETLKPSTEQPRLLITGKPRGLILLWAGLTIGVGLLLLL